MDSARFNLFWFLSLLTPLAIMLAATWFQRRRVLVAGILLSLAATWWMCNMAVEQKWRIRQENARTEQEIERAYADGANVVFTRFVFAPLEAAAWTGLWSVIGWHFWRRKARSKG